MDRKAMTREEALGLLKGKEDGIREWNIRRRHDEPIPSLSGTSLTNASLAGANLARADLTGSYLGGSNLVGASLVAAALTGADLTGANLARTNLIGADLGGANLRGANFSRAKLALAELSHARIAYTLFGELDLSRTRGLELVKHEGPSTLGIDTLFKSRGEIPEAFLRGCGVPETLIASLPSLLKKTPQIQLYTCFLSHSSIDRDFAGRLRSRMQKEGSRIWFDEDDMRGGAKLEHQIAEGVRVYDKLLIVLSENSMDSEWIKTELRWAFKQERQKGKRKLFPIRLVPYETIKDWTCFDADHGRDMAADVREYFLPDFSEWRDDNAFEAAFAELLRNLKAEALPPAK